MEKSLDKKEMRVNSSKKNVKVIRDVVKKLCEDLPFNSDDRHDIIFSVNEAHSNIIEHAYLNNENKEIIFTFYVYSDRLDIVIRDFGSGQIPPKK